MLSSQRVSIIVAAIAATVFIVPGLWAVFDPESFASNLAPFDPYKEHFIHDIGAFQVGIGVALAAALWRPSDALFAAFTGAGVGSALHTVMHFVDHDLGGKDSDVAVFGIVTAVLLAAAAMRLRGPGPDAMAAEPGEGSAAG